MELELNVKGGAKGNYSDFKTFPNSGVVGQMSRFLSQGR